jgi:hypothetical protein
VTDTTRQPDPAEIAEFHHKVEEWACPPVPVITAAAIGPTGQQVPIPAVQERIFAGAQTATNQKPATEKPTRATASDLLAICDCETSSLLPWSTGEILEFACVLLAPDLSEIGRFGPVRLRMLIPENADAGALAVNGIRREEIQHGRDPGEMWRCWIGWLRNHAADHGGAKIVLGGHNYAAFDSEFLRAAWKRYLPASATKGLFAHKTIDTMLLWYWHMTVCQGAETKCDLATCCREYSIPAPDHSAMADCVATVELLRALKQETCR